MRLVSCRYNGITQLGAIQDDRVVLLTSPDWPASMLSFIDGGPALSARLAHHLTLVSREGLPPLSALELLAPIPVPRKNIMCLGLNYVDHAKESAAKSGGTLKLPEHAMIFTKNVTSVNGPYSDIPYDESVTKELDWEVELAVVIGIGGRHIARADAMRHIFGYTVINDISARDLQFRHQQFFLGKSLEGACPMGPMIVTADEIIDPQSLDLRLWVNGALKQDSNTREQIFGIAEVIEVLSRGMRLEPGDIISTGTPSGVGFARTPPEFLHPGDIVECEVQGIGRLRNHVQQR